jgi:hypothetical protein
MMTTYSTKRPVVIPGYEPFNLADAYVLSHEIPPHTEVMRSITVSPTDTSEWGLSWTGVMNAIEEAPQSHAKGRTGAPWVPVWTLVVIFAGLVLIAFGWVLNDPITHLIYGAIHAN